MKILGIEATGNQCSVALCHGDRDYQKTIEAPKQQGELLLPLVEEALQSMHLAGSELDVIAFDCGPGSFTGVRLTTSVAQGLGFGWGKPLMAVSSLQALAYKQYCQNKSELPIWVAIDARKQEVYVAAYQFTCKGVSMIYPEQVIAPEQVPYADLTLSSPPEAIDIVNLARYQLANGISSVLPEKVQPAYLRNKVTD